MSTSPRSLTRPTRTGVRYTPQAKHSNATTLMRSPARATIVALQLAARPAQRITPTMIITTIPIVTPTHLCAATQSVEMTTLTTRKLSESEPPHSFSHQLMLLPSRKSRPPKTTWTLISMLTSPHRLLTSTNSEPRCARTSSSTANVNMETR